MAAAYPSIPGSINYFIVDFYHTGAYHNIIESVESLDVRRGTISEGLDYCDMVIRSPIADSEGNEYTWGTDITADTTIYVWINWTTYGHPAGDPDYTYTHGYFKGKPIRADVSGDKIKLRLVENVYTGMTQNITASYTSSNQKTIYETLCGISGVGYDTSGMHSENITGFNLTNTNITTAMNRLFEVTDPTYFYQQCARKYWFADGYTALNHDNDTALWAFTYKYDASAYAMDLSHEDAIISMPAWIDPISRIINDVTVKYTGGSVTASDATSISTYGKRSTVLYRPEWTNSTDAQNVANTIIAVFKDPSNRVTMELDLAYMMPMAIVGLGFLITDSTSGTTLGIPLKEMVLHYPALTVTATFDEIAYNTDDYGLSLDNRVSAIESYLPDQNLSIASSPSFGNISSYGMSVLNCAASASYVNAHDAEKSYTWLSAYAKQKTITFTNGLPSGTYRTYFEIKGAAAPSKVYGKVYKNGAAIGTERTVIGTSYTAFTEDFSGPLSPGDTIELWCYQNGGDGSGGYCRNFRIGYAVSLPTTAPSSNS